jgi:hypothetical protein
MPRKKPIGSNLQRGLDQGCRAQRPVWESANILRVDSVRALATEFWGATPGHALAANFSP